MTVFKIENFNSLLAKLKKSTNYLVFVVGKPSYIKIQLEEKLILYRFSEIQNYQILEFDNCIFPALNIFFRFVPFSVGVICLLPSDFPKITRKELRLQNDGNLDEWLLNLYFKIRDLRPVEIYTATRVV